MSVSKRTDNPRELAMEVVGFEPVGISIAINIKAHYLNYSRVRGLKSSKFTQKDVFTPR